MRVQGQERNGSLGIHPGHRHSARSYLKPIRDKQIAAETQLTTKAKE